MKKIKIITLILISFNFFTSLSYACDRKDPLCVAKKITELPFTLINKSTKTFYCHDNDLTYYVAVELKKELISRYKKKELIIISRLNVTLVK